MSDVLSTDDLVAIARTLNQTGITLAGPLQATQIAGGRSNQTFRLDDGTQSWVLRMPPRVGRTPSAHDVGREFRVTSGLAQAGFPVPPPVVHVADEELIGGPFTIAEFVPGRSIQSRDELDELDDATLARTAEELVTTLAALHRVDYAAVGLGDFGRPDGYAERQLRRWAGQWEIVGTEEHAGLAGDVIRQLQTSTPTQQHACVVHGDYRIDNTLLTFDPAPRVAAVVDWELSTLGDPVADVALMCAYRAPELDLILGVDGAWASSRLPSPAALAEAYERAGGYPLADFGSHLALAYFKIAVIVAGIDHRHRAGATTGQVFANAGSAVGPFLTLARDAAVGWS